MVAVHFPDDAHPETDGLLCFVVRVTCRDATGFRDHRFRT